MQYIKIIFPTWCKRRCVLLRKSEHSADCSSSSFFCPLWLYPSLNINITAALLQNTAYPCKNFTSCVVKIIQSYAESLVVASGDNILSLRQPPGLVVSVSPVTLNRQDRTSNAVCSDGFFHPPLPPTTLLTTIQAALLAVHLLLCSAGSFFIQPHPLTAAFSLFGFDRQGHADIAVNIGFYIFYSFEKFVSKSPMAMLLHWRYHWIATR